MSAYAGARLSYPDGINKCREDHSRQKTGVINLTQTIVIPDLHADPDRLEASLRCAAVGARIAFLGDFIDAGRRVPRADDAAVLDRVMALVEAGVAIGVMGNHELNALLFHRLNANGVPLRPRDAKNVAQHRSFCARFGIGTREALDRTAWFLTLPLWQDLDGLRLVHACWDPDAIATIAARRPDGRLREVDLEEVAGKQTPFAKAVDLIVSGPQIPLPPGVGFHDAAGHYRSEVRIAWWRADARTWREAALSVPDPHMLPEAEIEVGRGVTFYGTEAPPVLVGHYKMQGHPRIEGPKAACLDYPKTPCIYQWAEEDELRPDGLKVLD